MWQISLERQTIKSMEFRASAFYNFYCHETESNMNFQMATGPRCASHDERIFFFIFVFSVEMRPFMEIDVIFEILVKNIEKKNHDNK